MYEPISAKAVAYIKDVSFQEILTDISWFQEILPGTEE